MQSSSSRSAVQQPGDAQTASGARQTGPLQAPAPLDRLPSNRHATDPRAIVFNFDYRQHGTRPPQLEESDLFPQALRGEQGWAFTYRVIESTDGSRENWMWVVLSVGGETRRGWVPQSKLLPGQFLRSPLPIQYAKGDPTLPQLNQRQGEADSVLYRTMKGIWQMIKDNKETVLEPLGGEPDDDEDVFGADTRHLLYGPETGRYVDLIYNAIVPGLRKIMDDGQFSPREFFHPPEG